MSNCRAGLSSACGGQLGEQGGRYLPSDVGESVAIKEKEWSPTVAVTQKLYGFGKGEDGIAFFFPFSRCRFLSLSIKAVLRASSCARSSVEADDKLPTPVFEKLGSGL
jgi:hypothetical protein